MSTLADPPTPSSSRRLVADPVHGPLAALMLVLTVLTGVVDAVSILSLGRVFVANMTGNVVFVGFALAGAAGFSLAASLSALGGFLIGAAIGGAASDRLGAHRGRLLAAITGGEFALLVVALVIARAAGPSLGAGARDGIAALAAVAMGAQNAAVRRLKVFDLTTTVLTMTLTGIAADTRRGDRFAVVRRVLAVLAGAVAGALLVLHVGTVAALGLAAALVGIVAVCATSRVACRRRGTRRNPETGRTSTRRRPASVALWRRPTSSPSRSSVTLRRSPVAASHARRSSTILT